MTSFSDKYLQESKEAVERDDARLAAWQAQQQFRPGIVAKRAMKLPSDSASRKATPICTGVVDYFPRALAAVAQLSKIGNDKHNPGEPLHWARGKSMDQADCIMRHLIDRGTIDPDSGLLHDVGLAWRALANLELALEAIEAKS